MRQPITQPVASSVFPASLTHIILHQNNQASYPTPPRPITHHPAQQAHTLTETPTQSSSPPPHTTSNRPKSPTSTGNPPATPPRR